MRKQILALISLSAVLVLSATASPGLCAQAAAKPAAKPAPASKADPKLVKDTYDGAIKLMKQARFVEGIVEIKKVIDMDPNHAQAYNAWGLGLFGLGQYDESLTKYKKATELDPKLAKAYYNWGLALNKLGREKEALQKLKKAASLSPERRPEINELVKKTEANIAAKEKKPQGQPQPKPGK